MNRRIRDFGYVIGKYKTGEKNKITDVPGVQVGHWTVDEGMQHTGVTVVLPGKDNAYLEKYTAAVYVHNGFGKTCGLMQVEELGTLETPVVLTNTLNVGKMADALVAYMIDETRKEGEEIFSINPVVGECNDSRINRIQNRIAGENELRTAISEAGPDFEEGNVGAGTGTVCYGLKGGIGSSSRIVRIGESPYTIGVLVQTNFGATEDLKVSGEPVGLRIKECLRQEDGYNTEDRGSIMTVVATDLPVTERQLYRIIRRCGVGIARTGSYTGHGSGEVMIGFTTANRVKAGNGNVVDSCLRLREDMLNPVFDAVAESTEEAILNSMTAAQARQGLDGRWYRSLSEFLKIRDRQESAGQR